MAQAPGLGSEAREDRLLAEELERDAARWVRAPTDDVLWHRRRLAGATELVKLGHIPISADARSFLRRSRRAERRVQVLLAASAMLVGVAGVAIAVSTTRAAAKERRLAEAMATQLSATLRQALEAEVSISSAVAPRRGGEPKAATEVHESVGATLLPPNVGAVFEANRSRLLSECLEPAGRKRGPRFIAGTGLFIGVELLADGTARQVRVVAELSGGNSPGDWAIAPWLETCVADEVGRWRFPSAPTGRLSIATVRFAD